MEMRIGKRTITGEIREREEARQVYEAAKSTGRKAALVDQQRPNLFSTSAANINPGESVQLTLEYFEELTYRDGGFSLAFPLTYTPRFMPPGLDSTAEEVSCEVRAPDAILAAAPRASGRQSVPRASLRVHLRPGIRLRELASESHAIDVAEVGDVFAIKTSLDRIPADRDFLLSWEPELGAQPSAAVFTEERDDGRYALIMLMPPRPQSESGLGLATETLFIVDVSSSMSGPSIAQARVALLSALDRLRPEDRFNILKFSQVSEPWRDGFQYASAETLEQARGWVRNLHVEGGTMIHPAMMRGLAMMGESRSSHAQRMIFLTDGAVGNEAQLLGGIVEHLGDVRLHTIGIGHAPNRYLMRKMAKMGRGLCDFVSTGSGVENKISAFFERLDRPVMTDLQLSWEGVAAEAVYPSKMPDLHAGQPLLLSARLTGDAPAGRLKLGGYSRLGWSESELALEGTAQRESGVATRWARSRVESLMDSLHEGADPGSVRREVVDVALAFGLVTSYTSLVAVEEVPTALGTARPARLAGALPAGGTNNPLRLRLGLVLTAAGLGLLALLWVRKLA